MKKLQVILLTALTAAMIFGCGKSDNKAETNTPTVVSESNVVDKSTEAKTEAKADTSDWGLFIDYVDYRMETNKEPIDTFLYWITRMGYDDVQTSADEMMNMYSNAFAPEEN